VKDKYVYLSGYTLFQLAERLNYYSAMGYKPVTSLYSEKDQDGKTKYIQLVGLK
jgi:hypothetical protein